MAGIFERFTDQARHVVVLGQEEARLRGHDEIGTEHMLLGLVDDAECDGAKTLDMLRISRTEVRTHVEQIVGRCDQAATPTGPIPFTARAKKALELSSREAVRLGRNDIGTDHILLGIVREGQGVAAQVLVNLGADLPRTRETVVELSNALGAQRERLRAISSPTIEDDTSLAEDAPVTARDLLDYDDPSVLGAAATLPSDRTRSSQRVGGRKERMPQRPRSDDTAPSAPRTDAPATGGESDVVSVFEPRKTARPELRPYVELLWKRRRFMVALAKAEIRGTRSSTVLGSLWGLIDPIFQAAIYLFLFFVIRGGQGRAVSFLPVMLGGIFLFRLASGAVNDGGRSVRNAKELMLSSTFPRAILPLASIYKGLLNFIPSIFVFAIVYFLFGAPLHNSLVLLPVLFVIQLVTDIGIALLMSTATVFVKDIENSLSFITRILLFTTPIIYPVSLLPPGLKTILSFNPLFPLFAAYQGIISGGGANYGLMFQAMCWAVVLFALGAWLFLRYEHAMATRL